MGDDLSACPEAVPYRLRTPPVTALARRASRVTGLAGTHLGLSLVRKASGATVTAAEVAAPLRRVCDRSGATFLKFGQIVASSPSLFGEAMAAEFRSCLDTGPRVGFERVVAEIERGLARPWHNVFAHLDPEPLGRASLAVVHRGRLHDGREVAVKVLRPGIEAKVAADLTLMRRLFGALRPAVGAELVAVLVEVLSGLRGQLQEELDLRNEARVMAYFRALPESERLPLVVVPEPYPEASGRRVLSMEFLDGVPIDDMVAIGALGRDPKPLVEQVIKAWFITALRGGVFHGDVHAGNILLLRDGRVGVIDWGIVGRLSPDSHFLLRRFIAAALGEEEAWDDIVDHLMSQLGSLGVQLDVGEAALRAMLREQVATVVTRPFGEFSLAEMVMGIQRGMDPASAPAGAREHIGRLRGIGPAAGVVDRGMLLLAKQLAYFERYGKLYLGDVPVLQDREFFASVLAAGPLEGLPS